MEDYLAGQQVEQDHVIACEILINVVRKYFCSAVFHASEDAKFALATLGNDAGFYMPGFFRKTASSD